jgi:hypothetical protein
LEIFDPASKVSGSIRLAAIAGSRIPSIIAVNVFLVKPSTRSGRLVAAGGPLQLDLALDRPQ